MPVFSAPLLWFAAGVLLIGLEMLLPAGAFLFFGAGCLAGWLAALAGAGLAAQILCAVAVCLATLALFRKRLARIFSGGSRDPAPDEVSAPWTGAEGRTVEAMVPGREGQIALAGSYWRAVSDTEIAAGARVKVTGSAPGDSQLLRVRPLEEGV